MLDAPLLAKTLAFGPLWRAVCDMPQARSTALADCLMGLIERPETRQFVCPGMDLAAVLAGFTNVPVVMQDHYDQRVRTTEQVTLRMLTSWEGLLYLCMDNRAGLRALVSALQVDQIRIQAGILATLTSLFLTDAPRKTSKSDHNGSRLDAPPVPRPAIREQFLGLVLKLLLDVQLLDSLVGIVRDSDELRPAASRLLQLVLNLARRVFPESSSELHSFPALVHLVCGTHEPPVEQLTAKTALLAIDAVESHLPFGVVDSTEHKRQYLEDVRVQLDASMEDYQFRSLLRDSMVMATKEHQAWNVSVLHELLDGPLLNARRFDEALGSTKLIRRLLSFYRPFSLRYSALRMNPANEQWTTIGRKYFRMVLQYTDGVRFLAEDRFLSEIREAFEQLVAQMHDAFFSARQLRHTVTGGYFDFLQVFSESASGLELLSNARLYTPLLALCGMEDHAALIVETLVQTLDYTHNAPTRIFLRRALTAGTPQVRLTATVRVSQYLWLDAEPQDWAARMLVEQLHDVAPQVRRLAAQLVQDACAHPSMLECVMRQYPLIDLLSEDKDQILLRFLSQPASFADLFDRGFVAQQAEHWYNFQNTMYVGEAEQVVGHALDANAPPLPIHFYSQLVATDAGCAFLADVGHVGLLKSHLDDSTKDSALLRCKAAVWALVCLTLIQGHVGTSAKGVALLEENDAVTAMTTLANTALVVSVRATCFYALNLLTATQYGADILKTKGWHAVHAGISLCLPTDATDFVNVRLATHPRYPLLWLAAPPPLFRAWSHLPM